MTAAEAAVTFALLGAASTPHCAAMCGPLAARACAGGRGSGLSARSAAAYVAGRATSYVFVGVLAGALGERFFATVGPSVGVVAAELVALVLLVEAIGLVAPGRFGAIRGAPWARGIARVAPRTGLGLGLATGFLPCGALLSAILLAAATGSALSAAVGMSVFAFATIPGLAVAPMAIAWAARSGRAPGAALDPQRARRRSRLAGVLIAALALWVAARPLTASPTHGACAHSHPLETEAAR